MPYKTNMDANNLFIYSIINQFYEKSNYILYYICITLKIVVISRVILSDYSKAENVIKNCIYHYIFLMIILITLFFFTQKYRSEIR